ncbi:MAG: hypothetical protein QM759_02290 [Terricaulis sp.]
MILAFTWLAFTAFGTLSAILAFWAILPLGALLAVFVVAARFFPAAFATLTAAFTETVASAAATVATELAVAGFAIEVLLLLALRELTLSLFVAAAFARTFRLCGRFGFHAFFAAFKLAIGVLIVVEPFLLRLLLRLSRLHGAHQAEIVIGVLREILAEHAVTRGRSIARVLLIALVDHRRRTTNLRVLGAVALHRTIWVVMPAAVVAATALMSTAARSPAPASLTLHRKICH